MKNITIIEFDISSESPMIGTVLNVRNNEHGNAHFEGQLKIALRKHFDCGVGELEVSGIKEALEAIHGHEAYKDIKVSCPYYEGKIRLLETWIY